MNVKPDTVVIELDPKRLAMLLALNSIEDDDDDDGPGGEIKKMLKKHVEEDTAAVDTPWKMMRCAWKY